MKRISGSLSLCLIMNHFALQLPGDTRINVNEYQQTIGCFMLSMITNSPDIAFVMGKLSQYMSEQVKYHGHALMNKMRYIQSTTRQNIRYAPGGEHDHFVKYSDADWASDKSDRKSVSGHIVMFYGGPIALGSKKQRSVMTSSCESEYKALAMCRKQEQCVAQVFRGLGRPQYISKVKVQVQMLGDNQGVLALSENPHLHERSKHIDISHHCTRIRLSTAKLL